jgi:hypothetical protein
VFLGFLPKRHQLLMVFPNSSKVDVFWVSFGLNFEDEGANICLFFLIFLPVWNSEKKV